MFVVLDFVLVFVNFLLYYDGKWLVVGVWLKLYCWMIYDDVLY